MPKTPPSSDNAKIAMAALKLANMKTWGQLTLEVIAKTAHIPSASLKKRFKTTVEIVPLIAEEIDRKAFVQVGKLSGTAHDKLFDVLMARFDVLQKNRKAILNMADAAHVDRPLACSLGKETLNGVYRIIEYAKIDRARPILAAEITAAYCWSFFIWRRDQTADMSKTMAALDRSLHFAGKVADILHKNSRSP